MDEVEQVQLSFTQKEYDAAKSKIERRLVEVEGKRLFPLRKDQYVAYTDRLIYETIYGEQVANEFLKNLTGLPELIAECQAQSKAKKTVTAIDGRELYSRSPHSALNLLLQGSAGVIAKKWMVNYNELAQNSGLTVGKEYWQCAYVHDEYQVATQEKHIEEMCSYLEKGAAMVTEQFKTNIPIKADAGAGENWSQTH